MNKRIQNCYILTGALFLLFALLTAAVLAVDVGNIGPRQSSVGLSSINGFVFELLGENSFWYDVTKGIGDAVLLIPLGFAVWGLVQLIRRKSIRRVDADILLLGATYVLLFAFYGAFEIFIVNYRPVILQDGLEASFPSSHTALALCILATAVLQLRPRIKNVRYRIAAEAAASVLIFVMVTGRLLSGVHWFTDIVGGVLLGTALSMLYYSVTQHVEYRRTLE